MSNEKDWNNFPPLDEEDNTDEEVDPKTGKPKKRENWCVMLYPDNERHAEAIKTLIDDTRAVGCLHDRDIDADGQPKKPHYHFIVKLTGPGTRGSVSRIIPNVEDRFIKPCRCIRGATRYLIHKDHTNKAQYEQEEIVGNVKLARRYLNTTDDEGEDVSKLLEFIESNEHTLRTADVLRFALDNNLYSVYRRGASIINALIKEHNQTVYNLAKGEESIACADLIARRHELDKEKEKIMKRIELIQYVEQNYLKGENEQ